MKLLSDKYNKAAELIVKGDEKLACHAIMEATNFEHCYEDEYVKYFFDPGSILFNNDVSWFGNYNSEQNQIARSLSLLFMEQIIKDSERKNK